MKRLKDGYSVLAQSWSRQDGLRLNHSKKCILRHGAYHQANRGIELERTSDTI